MNASVIKKTLAGLAAFSLYFILSLVYTFPLVRVLNTHLLCPPGQGYTYIWNIWFFQYAIKNGLNPLWNHLQYLPMGSSLLTHTYTMGHGIFGYVFQSILNPIAALNLSLLMCVALGSLSGYLIARTIGLSQRVSFLTGFFVGFNSFALRQLWIGTYEYCGYWTMSMFLWQFIRTLKAPKFFNVFLSGLFLSTTFLYGQYYVTFSLILGTCLTFGPFIETKWADWNFSPSLKRIALVVLGLGFLCGGVWIARDLKASGGQIIWAGQGSFREIFRYVVPYWVTFGCLVGFISLYFQLKPWVRFHYRQMSLMSLWPLVGAVFFYALLNGPLIFSVLSLSKVGMSIEPPSRWRGGGSPIEVLRYLNPNVNHPVLRPLIDHLNWDFFFVDGSLGWILPIFLIWYFSRHSLPKARIFLFCGIISWFMSLGPYLMIAGFHTYFPLPFWIIRQIPMIGSPIQAVTYFSFATFLFFSVAAGLAIQEMMNQAPTEKKRNKIFYLAAGLTVYGTLISMPGPIKVDIPKIYERFKSAPAGNALALPFGVHLRFARTPYGDFDRRHLVFQTIHQHPMISGVSTRLPYKYFSLYTTDPTLLAFNEAQKGKPLSPYLTDLPRVRYFLKAWDVNYLIVEKNNIPENLFKTIDQTWPVTVYDHEGDNYIYRVQLK